MKKLISLVLALTFFGSIGAQSNICAVPPPKLDGVVNACKDSNLSIQAVPNVTVPTNNIDKIADTYKSSNSSLSVLLIVGGIVVLVGGAYVGWQLWQHHKNTVNAYNRFVTFLEGRELSESEYNNLSGRTVQNTIRYRRSDIRAKDLIDNLLKNVVPQLLSGRSMDPQQIYVLCFLLSDGIGMYGLHFNKNKSNGVIGTPLCNKSVSAREIFMNAFKTAYEQKGQQMTIRYFADSLKNLRKLLDEIIVLMDKKYKDLGEG